MRTKTDAVYPVSDLIFALDIGTRSVTGVVGIPDGGLLRILDIESAEHDGRSVVDGQIENVDMVSKVIKSVKDQLELRLGVRFQNVCVAAAGRTLRTESASYTFSLDSSQPIDNQMILYLEEGALQQAKNQVAMSDSQTEDSISYTCVGYTVLRYYLDDYPINTLIDHRGKTAKVDIIATFLPGEVVESLNDATGRAGLRVASLTLEPIAAMNAVIPQELRLLNLALVDIGAGTSDIAVSNDGCVTAYEMVTVAGDEITEAIAKQLLVDFDAAEDIKLKLAEPVTEIVYENILGFEYSTEPEKIVASIRPHIENLAKSISDKILQINGKAPSAVFLVGGGSKTPAISEIVAEYLGLERNKIAVGSGNYMKRNLVSELPIDGPELATPIGIALTSAGNLREDGAYVYVNDVRTRLLTRDLNTVMDAVLLNGYNHDDIIGRNGSKLSFTINGKKHVLRGEISLPAEILLNGKPAAATSIINSGDKIRFKPSIPGKDATCTVREAIKMAGPRNVLYKEKKIPLRIAARINGQAARRKDFLKNGDELMLYVTTTLANVCSQLGFDPDEYRLFLNGVERDKKTKVAHGDTVDFQPIELIEPTAPTEPPENMELMEITETIELAEVTETTELTEVTETTELTEVTETTELTELH
ncbi:MAG: cell division protein FtsA [Clostridiales bacterium]|nr:cell division protein FtsA [Clostridiales bacterium]